MNATRRQGRVTITLEPDERRLFCRALEEIVRNYKTPPEELPKAVGQVWYSTAGCRSARLSPEETGEWVNQLRAVRNSRLRLLQRCVRELQTRKQAPSLLRLSVEQAGTLMTCLNDHRLFLAACHSIGEMEMTPPVFLAALQLTPARRKALMEITMLGIAVEVLITAVDPEAAAWMD